MIILILLFTIFTYEFKTQNKFRSVLDYDNGFAKNIYCTLII
jgi:hypothetical protein